MQKSAKILLWVSLGIEVLYAIAALIAMVIANAFNDFGTPDGSAYPAIILLYVTQIGIPLLVKILFTVILFFGLKEKSEKIITEILAIISFSGIFSILSRLITNIGTIFIAKAGEEALVTYHYAGTGLAWVGFLHSISTILFIVAVSFSIAYKKIELADIRRISEEEEA